MKNNLIICLGLPGSGSTWIWNALIDYCKAIKLPVNAYEATILEKHLSNYNTQCLNIVKCHTLDQDFFNYCHNDDIPIVVSDRDKRDSFISIINRLGYIYGKAPQFWSLELSRSIATVETVKNLLKNIIYIRYHQNEFDTNTLVNIIKSLDIKLNIDKAALTSSKYCSTNIDKIHKFEEHTSLFNSKHVFDLISKKWQSTKINGLDLITQFIGDNEELTYDINKLVISEMLFGCQMHPQQHVYITNRVSSIGLKLISPFYLPIGKWRFCIHGDYPNSYGSFWLKFVDSGSIVFQKYYPNDTKLESITNILEYYEFFHSNHNGALELIVDQELQTSPDPYRNNCIKIEFKIVY